MARSMLVSALVLALVSANAQATEFPPADGAAAIGTVDAGIDIPARVEALLAQMTLAEKIGQLRMGGWSENFDVEEARSGIIGSLTGTPDAKAALAALNASRQSRLGIPILLTDNVIHGFRTLMPAPIGLAATFDPALVEKASAWAGYEAAAAGLHSTLAPMVDITRDPRWGRVVEGPGEDPVLASAMSAAQVTGLLRSGIAATLKHYVGYGAAEAGRDYNSTWIPPQQLKDLYLPPFEAGVRAGALSVMAAFNALNGLPATANPETIDTILKVGMGFQGFVVSDWDSVWELQNHGVAIDGAEATRKALNAGLDVEMAGDMFKDNLAAEVASGRVPLTRVDDAVRRVLRVKYALGLFSKADGADAVVQQLKLRSARPEPNPATSESRLMTPAARAVAREAAAASMVLLENRNQTLPLKADAKRIAVIGSMADTPSDHMGPWGANGREGDVVTTLAGLKARAPKGTDVVFAAGCDRECKETQGFAEAVAAAKTADVVIAVMGETWYHTAEGASRTRLNLPGHYDALLEALVATGKPVVLVVLGGRPMTINWAAEHAAAVVYAWFPGTEAGAALADVLYGDVDPSGRLPMTFPRAVGQIPIYYAHLPTGRPATGDQYSSKYIDEQNDPLYPFGYGLSYGHFAYSDLSVAVLPEGGFAIDVTVTNDGKRPGTDVVQFYGHRSVSAVSQPVRQLVGFQKLSLAAGESRRVRLVLDRERLTLLGEPDSTRALTYDVWAGGSSQARLKASLSARF